MFSWTEILVVISIGVLVFSGKKLPALGRSLRDAVLGFKKGIQGKADERPLRDVTPPPPETHGSQKK